MRYRLNRTIVKTQIKITILYTVSNARVRCRESQCEQFMIHFTPRQRPAPSYRVVPIYVVTKLHVCDIIHTLRK